MAKAKMNSKMGMMGGGKAMAIGNALARGETRMKKAMGGTKGYAKGGATKGYAKGGAGSQPSYSEAMPKAGPN
tara:strand:- start:402 stop:620 length:219 start_codon:yes stop_codon:yes gene_type:complete